MEGRRRGGGGGGRGRVTELVVCSPRGRQNSKVRKVPNKGTLSVAGFFSGGEFPFPWGGGSLDAHSAGAKWRPWVPEAG